MDKVGHLNKVLEYAARGWRVFPLFYVLKEGGCSCRRENCKRIGKHPTTKNGLQDATTEEATIRQWWGDMPWANIGLATGHGGLVVMDIDDSPIWNDAGEVTGHKVGPASLEALIAANEPLPETLTLKTGSGGKHYYFLTTEDISNSADKLGKHIDVRGQGGYCILPPSNHKSGGKYEWIGDPDAPGAIADLPDWLAAKMVKKKHIDATADYDAAEGEEVKKQSKSGDKMSSEQLVKLLAFIPADCDRDTWWKIGAALKKELGDERGWEAFEEWSKTGGAAYDADVARRHWDSFEDKGITGGTIVHIAKDKGFRGFDKEAADGEEFKQNWVYLAAIKRFVETGRLLEWDKEQFDAMFSHMFERGKPSEHVLRNPAFKKLESATYWPAQEMYVTEGGQTKLNYWRPSGVVAEEGDVSMLLNHVKFLWPDGGPEGDILLDYLAYQVQFPGEKVHWAVMIQGDQGNGKSYFATLMRTVLGYNNVRMVVSEALHEAFTSWQRNTQLIVVEEMMAKQRLDLMNKLKPMITEPWCTIREMYRPPYEQPNRFNFLFFTNHDKALIVDNTDRRYCILRTHVRPHPLANAYYGPLFHWTRQNGPALLHYLQSRPLGDFKAKAHAPMTEGKRAMIASSMLPLDSFIYEHVESCEYPFRHDLVSPATLAKPLSEFNLRANPKELGEALGRLGYQKLGRTRLNGVEQDKVYLWAVRNAESYLDLTSNQLKAMFLEQAANQSGTGSLSDADAIYNGRPKNPVVNGKPM